LLCQLVPRQQKAAAAVKLIQETVEQLVAQCKDIVEAENERLTEEEYVNESDPSVLRFLLASREEVGRELERRESRVGRFCCVESEGNGKIGERWSAGVGCLVAQLT
jgi:hypothetical protein